LRMRPGLYVRQIIVYKIRPVLQVMKCRV
jgi:hypothetical protein